MRTSTHQRRLKGGHKRMPAHVVHTVHQFVQLLQSGLRIALLLLASSRGCITGGPLVGGRHDAVGRRGGQKHCRDEQLGVGVGSAGGFSTMGHKLWIEGVEFNRMRQGCIRNRRRQLRAQVCTHCVPLFISMRWGAATLVIR